MALAQLLFHLLGHKVNRRVQITLAILGVQVGTGHGQPQGAGELAFRHFQMVVFHRDPRTGGVMIQVFQFFNSGENMIFNRFGQGDVVRRENELHTVKLPRIVEKIQQNSSSGSCRVQDRNLRR